MKKSDLLKMMKDDGVNVLKFIFVDTKGTPKAIDIGKNNFDSALDGNVGIDGSSIYGMADVNKSDLLLNPDFESFRMLSGGVGLAMCYIENPDGSSAKGCKRSVLRKELDSINDLGYYANVGFEPEFFLLKNMSTDRNRKDVFVDEKSYADIEIGSLSEQVMYEIMLELENAGIIPMTAHHERASSQFEITYKYADAMRSCDNLILGKLITKRIAQKHGLYANFDPKPFDGVNGSGLHTNVSLMKKRGLDFKNIFKLIKGNNYENVFHDDGGLSMVANSFTAGVLKHAKGLVYLTNPTEDSYKRLVPNCEAPTSVCWGYHNRSAMIRIPTTSAEATRVEVRSPDSTMNPYAGVAGILRAGMDGVKNNIELTPAIDGDVGKMEGIESLPHNLNDARREFEKSELFKGM